MSQSTRKRASGEPVTRHSWKTSQTYTLTMSLVPGWGEVGTQSCPLSVTFAGLFSQSPKDPLQNGLSRLGFPHSGVSLGSSESLKFLEALERTPCPTPTLMKHGSSIAASELATAMAGVACKCSCRRRVENFGLGLPDAMTLAHLSRTRQTMEMG